MKINKTENLHKHIKGSYKDYDPEVHKNAIYFAEDKKKIIVNGIEYGLDLESDEVDLISNINHKDNKLIITFSNGKTKEIELEDHRAYWEELRIEESFPVGGCIISTHPIKEFSFKGASNNKGKWYSSDGQEGEYNNTDLTTITFKEEGEYTLKFVNNYTDGWNGLENVTDNSVKSVLMIGGSNGVSYGVKPVNKNENAKLILNNNITSIGENAFGYCSGFTGELKLPESLTNIGSGAFYGCSGFIGELKLPESVTNIRLGAFNSCSGFTGELKLPDSLTIIGENAFGYCSGFTSLKLPDSVTSIEGNAFYGCSGFTGELKLPDSLTSVVDGAFQDCSGFTSLKLPDSLTSIGVGAFRNCKGFTGELVIPESVVSIGFGTFSGCKGLSKIYVCEDTKLDSDLNKDTPAEVIKYKKGEKPWL